MKMGPLIAASVLVSIVSLQVAEGTAPSSQSATSKIHNIPSTKAAQNMIMGEWEMSGPIPSSEWITRHKIWNTQCWSRYTILGVRAGKANKSNAYVVEVKFTSSGGSKECGRGDKPSFSIALIPEDSISSGKAMTIFWLDCKSERAFRMALQHQDPRDSDEWCSSFVSGRVDHE